MTSLITSNWIKQLVKEDIAEVKRIVVKEAKDLRLYIDSNIPFAFYLDISDINEKILNPNTKFFELIATELQDSPSKLITVLRDAYIKTINYYINGPTFVKKTTAELDSIMREFDASINNRKVKAALSKLFSKTIVITDASKLNERVLIITPSFRTVSDRFGTRVKSFVDYNQFDDFIDDRIGDSPRNVIKRLLKEGETFSLLQNIGHLQAEVTQDKEVIKQGISTPRLLAALLDIPAGADTDRIAFKFSTETGQAKTKISVNKKFNPAGIALEILIERGFLIGSLETQEANLEKSKPERDFILGSSISAAIRRNPNLISELVSSKTINQYIAETVIGAIKNRKKAETYSSSSTKISSESIQIPTVRLDVKKPNSKNVKTNIPAKKPRIVEGVENIVNLMNFINQHLQHVISANMGQGDDRRVLNYRTGRLAASAKVENVTKSRDGMITAFYSYMKNPYATFSEGGRQQYPRTRDPKLLIGNSIKEIAATKVGNRLRAVLI